MAQVTHQRFPDALVKELLQRGVDLRALLIGDNPGQHRHRRCPLFHKRHHQLRPLCHEQGRHIEVIRL